MFQLPKYSSINILLESSSTDQRLTIWLSAPAKTKALRRPKTPSPVLTSPTPVLQAESTTSRVPLGDSNSRPLAHSVPIDASLTSSRDPPAINFFIRCRLFRSVSDFSQ